MLLATLLLLLTLHLWKLPKPLIAYLAAPVITANELWVELMILYF
jgi:hypothetical protein